jgi:hypothetical protein
VLCNTKDHHTDQCPHLAKAQASIKNERPHAYAAVPFVNLEVALATAPNTTATLLDSGATTHFVKDSSIMHNMQKLSEPVEVRTANNGTTVCDTEGEIHLATRKGELSSKAIFAPTFSNNLVSLHQLITETNGRCVLQKESWQLQSKEGSVLIEGVTQGDLYIMPDEYLATPEPISTSESPPSDQFNANAAQTNCSWCMYHFRFNHASPKLMTELMKAGKIPTIANHSKTCENQVCDICAKSKITQAKTKIEKPLRHIAMAILERIHCDVAGALPVSIRGFKYFIVFVDEFSRHVLANPMRQKSEAADKFKRCLIDFKNWRPATKFGSTDVIMPLN